MTRINVGIEPSELCDQQLRGEYHEIWRCLRPHKGKPPAEFTLGRGHALWCSQFRGSIAWRIDDLETEILYRGGNPALTRLEYEGRYWTRADETRARPLLQARIIERLALMVREPKWTRREASEWARPVILARRRRRP